MDGHKGGLRKSGCRETQTWVSLTERWPVAVLSAAALPFCKGPGQTFPLDC